MTDQPRRASASDLRAAVLAWWAEHECDTGSADAGDGYSEEYNIYDEPPLFVQIAQGMAESWTPAQPVEAVDRDAGRDLVKRLRDTPNWMKESFGDWKSATTKYDRAPKEAADYIETLLAAIAHPRPTVAPEARDSDLHASAPDQHHQVARAVWEHMNCRSAPGVIMSMAYTAVLHALSNAAPTVEQAGEVVEAEWPGPWNRHHFPVDAIAKVFGKAAFEAASILRLGPPNHSDIGIVLLQQLGAAGFGICRDQPRPVGVPDGWAVRRIPTDAIVVTGPDGFERWYAKGHHGEYKFFDAMLAAAPAPGKGGEA